ncbi:MAG: hypothetical protein LBL00_07160 [Endomicrobium sp.]|jgi:hypothetical protein|nr:hypothetical protein [Endomicrobium sp.]
MKKIICITVALFICANTVFGYGSVQYDNFNEYKSKYRILYGALLVIGGGLLAYDGFRTVQVDISRPSVNMNFSSFWYKNTDNYLYLIRTKGNIENTGNVDLQNVSVWIRYKTTNSDGSISSHYEPTEYGKTITYEGNPEGASLPNLVINESKNFSVGHDYPTASTNPPDGLESKTSDPNADTSYVYEGQYPSSTPTRLIDIVSVEYKYKKKYKDEMNNAYEGILGLLLVAGGAYLLIDYVISTKKFDYYMKKNSMNFYVENTSDEFKFMLSKRI